MVHFWLKPFFRPLFIVETMDKSTELLKFLDTLILSIVESEDTVKINKTTLVDIQKCLQDAQENIKLLQLESQLQQEELK